MAVFLRPFAQKAMVAACSANPVATATRAFNSAHAQPQAELVKTTQLDRRIAHFNEHAHTAKLNPESVNSLSKIADFANKATEKTRAFASTHSPFNHEMRSLDLLRMLKNIMNWAAS